MLRQFVRILGVFSISISLYAQACAVHTVGGWPTTFAGEGQPAVSAQFYNLQGLAADKSGNLYIADTGNHRVRRMLASGIVETVAGTGASGFGGDDGPARAAQLSGPEAVLVAAEGSIYISDTQNHRIRRINRDGIIQTIAGTGQPGFSGDGGPAALAQIDTPRGLAFDTEGNLYFADSLNNRVRRISTDGTIRTVAGNGLWQQDLGLATDNTLALNAIVVGPKAIAIDSKNNLYIVQPKGLIRIDAEGLAHPSAFFVDPRWTAISVDRDDSLVVLGQGPLVDQVLQRIGTDGKITDNASGKFGPAMALDPGGQIYVGMAGNTIGRVAQGSSQAETVAGVSMIGSAGDNGAALRATFQAPSGIALGRDGSVYVADRYDYRIRRIGPDGIIRHVAGTGKNGSSGDGGPAAQAQLAAPGNLALDAAGNLYVAEGGATGRIRMIKPDGTISTVLGGGSTQVVTLAPPPFPSMPGTSAKITYPGAIAAAPDGALYIVAFDQFSSYAGLLRLTADGRVTQIYRLGSLNAFIPHPMAIDAAGNVYANGLKISADGTAVPDPAVAKLETVKGMAFDAAGNRYVAVNSRLMKLTKDGASGTIYNADLTGFIGEMGLNSAAQDIDFTALTADDVGNVYVADATARRIRKLDAGACQVTAAPVIKGFGTAWQRANGRVSGWLAPGSLISIYGDAIGPETPAFPALDEKGRVATQLAGVRVLFNNVPAPILYASKGQVNAIAPFSVLQENLRMGLELDGAKSDAVWVTASPVALSVLPTAMNEDGTLNSQKNPAKQGSIVTIWVSGLGFTNPPGIDGRPASLPLAKPVFPVSIDLGGSGSPVWAEIVYAGTAQGMVEGVTQINFRLPIQLGQSFIRPRLYAGSDAVDTFAIFF
jgi:uncharacterized protein (TIGR03437 family)